MTYHLLLKGLITFRGTLTHDPLTDNPPNHSSLFPRRTTATYKEKSMIHVLTCLKSSTMYFLALEDFIHVYNVFFLNSNSDLLLTPHSIFCWEVTCNWECLGWGESVFFTASFNERNDFYIQTDMTMFMPSIFSLFFSFLPAHWHCLFLFPFT